jgi:hypothetical protein
VAQIQSVKDLIGNGFPAKLTKLPSVLVFLAKYKRRRDASIATRRRNTPENGANEENTMITLKNDTAAGANGVTADGTPTISLFDAIAEADDTGKDDSLGFVRIGTDANFISVFTADAVPITAHYLPATDTWDKTYVQCLGEDCPACKAGLKRSDYLLLPVVDRVEGLVKVLRITRKKGPGQLLTELGQVLAMPGRERLVVRIIRTENYIHRVAIASESDLAPDLVEAVKAFSEKVTQGVLDVSKVISRFTAEELLTHTGIAKRLSLGRQA